MLFIYSQPHYVHIPSVYSDIQLGRKNCFSYLMGLILADTVFYLDITLKKGHHPPENILKFNVTGGECLSLGNL